MARLSLMITGSLSLLFGAPAALAQSRGVGEERRVQLSTSKSESISEQDIIVRGIRLIDEDEAPTEATPSGFEVGGSRGQFLRAEMFARCADRPRVGLLRRVIDGPPNAASSRQALDSLIRTNIACYADFPRPTVPPPELGECHGEMVGNLQPGMPVEYGYPPMITYDGL